MELSVLDLFSGIGGFSVGLESTNKFKTVAFCEQDKFCQKVLQKHWKDIPIHEDIKKLDGTKIKADVVVGGFPCKASQLLVSKKAKTMNDISGMKCLESLKRLDQDGLLAKMSKTLLTSQMEKSCKEFTMIWNLKVTKSKLLIFQLVRKEHGTKEVESGSLLPTPSASCYMDVVAPPQTVQKNSQGWSVTRVKSGVKYGAKLNDVMNKIGNKIGGKLNPNFLEFLMGYKQNHTLIEPTELKHLETQSYHKSLPKLDRQLSQQRRKMYRTPTAMDTGKDSFVYALKF